LERLWKSAKRLEPEELLAKPKPKARQAGAKSAVVKTASTAPKKARKKSA
jgi:hypothetical protein